jgi:putative ABC transport system permease protein
VATAGPRELTTLQASTLRTALARLPPLQSGLSGMAGWQASGGTGAMSPADMTQLSRRLAAAMRPPLRPDRPASWSAVSAPFDPVVHPAPQAVFSDAPPTLELVYRTMLRANSRLVSGSLPDTVTHLSRHHRAGQPRSTTTFEVAVTPGTAARFGLAPGSAVNLGTFPIVGTLLLRVTGIVRPLRPSSAFWQVDPALAAPVHPFGGYHQIWAAGVFIGPAELTALQTFFAGSNMGGEWYFGLDDRGLSPAQLPAFLASIERLTGSNPEAGTAAARLFASPLVISSGVASSLSPYLSQQQAASAIDSLLIVDEFLAGLILMLVCARLSADAHRPELTLLRARGGSARQAAARLLARTSMVTGPGIILGAALALVVLPSAASPASWLLAGLAAGTALAGPAVIAAWRHRQVRPQDRSRGEVAAVRPSGRRLTAELTVAAAAGAALAALRWRGVATAGDLYVSVTPVLVAAAAGLIAARLYPVPVRSLLRFASGRRGPVGFLGLAIAARSRLSTILPALTLVISLTMAAFATMIMTSASSSQAAAAWQQVGADVLFQLPGNNQVSPAAQRAIGAVPGVQRTAAVYTATRTGPFAADLLAGPGPARTAAVAGLVVVDPARYAALADQTPWPDFPAAALARGTGAASAVPVLLSSQAAAAVAGSGQPATDRGRWTIVLDGIRMPIRVAGTIGDTPAMPTGGFYVMLPAWATPRLPSIPGPDRLLATGTAIRAPQLRLAAARHLPGYQLTSRAQVLAGLVNSPGQAVAKRLYLLGIWVAVLLSVVAVLFGLAASARGRVQLIDRLSALGMASRQARALAVTEVLPLLCVAVLGTLAGGSVLAFGVGPVLNLAVFTGSAARVPVRPDLAMLLPAGGIVVLATVIVAAQSAAFVRRDVAAALRREEAG